MAANVLRCPVCDAELKTDAPAMLSVLAVLKVVFRVRAAAAVVNAAKINDV